MREVFQDVGSVLKRILDLLVTKDLVIEDGVVCGTSRPLKCSVGLQEEVPVARFCDTTINNWSVLRGFVDLSASSALVG